MRAICRSSARCLQLQMWDWSIPTWVYWDDHNTANVPFTQWHPHILDHHSFRGVKWLQICVGFAEMRQWLCAVMKINYIKGGPEIGLVTGSRSVQIWWRVPDICTLMLRLCAVMSFVGRNLCRCCCLLVVSMPQQCTKPRIRHAMQTHRRQSRPFVRPSVHKRIKCHAHECGSWMFARFCGMSNEPNELDSGTDPDMSASANSSTSSITRFRRFVRCAFFIFLSHFHMLTHPSLLAVVVCVCVCICSRLRWLDGVFCSITRKRTHM